MTLRRSGPLPRHRRLRPFSQKRTDEAPLRRAVVDLVRLRDRTCRAAALVAWLPCSGRLEVHEVIPRSAWRRGYLEPSNCLLLCARHHRHAGLHPVEAHRLGLHGYSWERPA